MKESILFKFCSRSRPNKFFNALDNLLSNLSDKENYKVICSLDSNDASMNTDEVKERIGKYNNGKIHFVFGESNNKVHAYNRDIIQGSDILICISDDMEFTQYGFDDFIRKDFNGDFDQLLHYPDGNTVLLITMPVMGMVYYNRFNYVYHSSYNSLWCDNEQMEVAQLLGKYKFIGTNLFKHNHPAFGKGENDEQYKYTESFYHIDNKNFLKRKYELNFGL